jgi:hypothetical protein
MSTNDATRVARAMMNQGKRGREKSRLVAWVENIVFFLILIAFVLWSTGCTNMTIVKLAEMCFDAAGKPVSSFNGSSGKVECK